MLLNQPCWAPQKLCTVHDIGIRGVNHYIKLEYWHYIDEIMTES